MGSTATPILAAKPIIDIDVVYDNTLHFDVIKTKLNQTGYYHNADQGSPERKVFKKHTMSGNHNILDIIPHQLYGCAADSEE
ncbi:GrpB family protein [Arsenicibacter rosenii]|uniref:GrpB family protein n=1 Tax=Arsenicibacter rosenii TaxID=1750698 RepID=UPI0035B5F587